MSHVDCISVEIKSLKALEKAANKLGGTFKEGQKHYAWYGTSVGDHPIPKGFTREELGKCEHAINFPNSQYEIGVVKDKINPENYVMLGDFWSYGGLSKSIGEGGWKIKQEYTIEQTIETAQMKNKRFESEVLPDRQRVTVYLN